MYATAELASNTSRHHAACLHGAVILLQHKLMIIILAGQEPETSRMKLSSLRVKKAVREFGTDGTGSVPPQIGYPHAER